MVGIALKADTSQVQKLFRGAAARTGEREVLQVGVNVVSQSVLLNFVHGGRPNGWLPPQHRPGPPLRDKGILMGSISGQVTGSKGIVSTVDKRANALHYGIQKVFGVTVKAHTRRRNGKSHKVKSHARKQRMKIPARPFMLMQVPEDILAIERILKKMAEGS